MGNAVEALGGTRSPETQRALVNPRPTRLGTIPGPDGKLATAQVSTIPGYNLRPGAVLTNNSTTTVRIQVAAWTTYYVTFKASAATGTCTLNGYPMLADATKDDTAGTRAPSAWTLPTSIAAVATTAVQMSVTSKGEEFFELDVVVSNGGSDSITVQYVDVHGV